MDNNALGETELVALLQDQERLAVSYRSSELAEDQRLALEYYDAMPFGDEEEGRSQVVSPDVAEAVDYMTISILRTVVSGDRVVEFEAKEEGEEDAAEEATEAVNYQFMRGQDGYKVLSDWLQSGLIEKIGVVKTMARKEMKKRRERLAEVSEDVLVSLMDEPGVKVLAATQDETGAYTVEVETQREQTCYEDIPIPSEEFLFSARLRDVDDMGYKAHRVMKTKSELIEMGFDRDLVEGLAAENTRYDQDSRSTVRWADEGEISSSNLPGMETVWLLEEYANIDMNGDGVSDYVSQNADGSWSVRFGNGAGFGPAIAIVVSGGAEFSISKEKEVCGWSNSSTVAGLHNFNGTGLPVWTPENLNGTGHRVVTGTNGSLSIGRLVKVENGYGATTTISYKNLKFDASGKVLALGGRLPGPEIAVGSTKTTNREGQILGAEVRHAYAFPLRFFDPASDRYVVKGYQDAVDVSIGEAPIAHQTISYGLGPAVGDVGQRYGRYLIAGRPQDIYTFEDSTAAVAGSPNGYDFSNPESFLGNFDGGLKTGGIGATSRVHHEWNTRYLAKGTDQPGTDFCWDMPNPTDFAASKSDEPPPRASSRARATASASRAR